MEIRKPKIFSSKHPSLQNVPKRFAKKSQNTENKKEAYEF